MGIRFDVVISGYLLSLPIFTLFVLDIFKINSKIVTRIVFIYIFSAFTMAFIICAADIPYFNQFFSRFSITAFAWLDSPVFVFKMIFQEPKYFLFIIPAIVLIFIFFHLLKKIVYNIKTSNINTFVKIPVYLFILGIMFLGIRGRITKKSPIRVWTAYFCDNSFLNQLGLNPVFTLGRSYLDSTNPRNNAINIIDADIARANVIKYLGIEKQEFNSPVARLIKPDSILSNKPNVIIVIMESMSTVKMRRHGNTSNLTPFLDSISKQSFYFENIYTAGKHTQWCI